MNAHRHRLDAASTRALVGADAALGTSLSCAAADRCGHGNGMDSGHMVDAVCSCGARRVVGTGLACRSRWVAA